MLDVGAVPDACIKDKVVIFGRQGSACISADDLARELGTINYEIVCDLTAIVPRIYQSNQSS
jgi:alanine racemase